MKQAAYLAALAGSVFMQCPAFGTGAECTCPLIKRTGGWCDHCNVGYVAGVKIESDLLFEALDAHGHDIDPDRMECPTCKKALETDGFCDRCRMGFVNKLAYLSRLTYHVAKGQIKDVDKITCPTCKENAQDVGWCENCRVGMLHHIAIEDPTDFRHASKAYAILQKAIKAARTCEICAAAIITDGRCPKCNIRYKDGDRVTPDKP